jgi:hypothetical protein
MDVESVNPSPADAGSDLLFLGARHVSLFSLAGVVIKKHKKNSRNKHVFVSIGGERPLFYLFYSSTKHQYPKTKKCDLGE